MHLHAPSEHTIDSRSYDLELMMVMDPVDDYKTQADKDASASSAKMGDKDFEKNHGIVSVLFYETDCKKSIDDKDCEATKKRTMDFFKTWNILDGKKTTKDEAGKETTTDVKGIFDGVKGWPTEHT